MNVPLSPELEAMIDEKVRSGRYESAGDVVREALQLLEQRDQQLIELRRFVQEGVDDADAGNVKTWNSETMASLKARIATQQERADQC